MKKRILSLIVLIFLLFIAGCGSNVSENSTPTDSSDLRDSTIVIDVPKKEPEVLVTEPLSDSGSLGDYEVAIGEIEFVQDFRGKDSILLNYSFTNNSEENRSASFSLSVKAFQNGVALMDAVVDEAIHDRGASLKDIQPGITIELAEAFKLTSDTAPIEVYISELGSLNNEKVGKTFEISEGGKTVLSVAPGVENAVELGKYSVSINSYEIGEDYEENPTLILYMGYTNNSDTDQPFYAAVDVTAFQDGIELDKAHFSDDSIMYYGNNYLDVFPGVGVGVMEGFVLSNYKDVQL